MRARRAVGLAGLLVTALAAPAAAQAPQLAGACSALPISGVTEARCRDVAAAVELLQPEAGLLLAGANPVLGTASPLGTRRGIPRVSLGGRITFVFPELPDVFDPAAGPGDQVLDFPVPLPQLDLAVGLLSGYSSGSGLGGLGAVDVLVSASIVPSLSELESTEVAWGVGGRLGILRESFALPGASVSLVYKRLGRIQLGSLADGDDAEFGADLRVLSIRAAASKSFLAFGVTVGGGWDRFRSDVDFRFVNPAPPGNVVTVLSEDSPGELETDRGVVFAEFRITTALVSWVLEGGFQGRDHRLLGDGVTEMSSGGLFGGVGVRLGL